MPPAKVVDGYDPREGGERGIKSPYPDIEVVREKELHEVLFEQILKYEDLPAMTDAISGETLTYRELYEKARAFGAGLVKEGFKKGDIAAVILPNCLEFPVAMLGCWSAGLTVVTLNPRYTKGEILQQLTQAPAQGIITESAVLATVLKSKAQNPTLRTVIYVGALLEEQGKEALNGGCVSFLEVVNGWNAEDVTFSTGKNTDTAETIAWLAFSSGTTGPPKLAELSHAFLATNIMQYTQDDIGPTKGYLETGQQERLVALFPFFHAGGLTLSILFGLYQGSHAMILPRFEPSLFLRIVREHKPTCLHLATSCISHMVKSSDFSARELESVHTVFGGGAPIGHALIQQLLNKAGRYIFFLETYGMTETLFCHTLNPSSRNTKIGSCGRCVPSTTARIIDLDTSLDLEAHQNGEILVKGPVPFKGYFKNEAATRTLIDEDGWVHTGDVGYYDDDGYFYIVDRIKELIKVNAFQVAPSELENLLRKHPKVADSVVIGVPSVQFGEVPRAYIVSKTGETLTPQEIQDYLNPLVARYKQLKGGVEFVETIVKSPTGKNLRRVLKEEYQRKQGEGQRRAVS